MIRVLSGLPSVAPDDPTLVGAVWRSAAEIAWLDATISAGTMGLKLGYYNHELKKWFDHPGGEITGDAAVNGGRLVPGRYVQTAVPTYFVVFKSSGTGAIADVQADLRGSVPT